MDAGVSPPPTYTNLVTRIDRFVTCNIFGASTMMGTEAQVVEIADRLCDLAKVI